MNAKLTSLVCLCLVAASACVVQNSSSTLPDNSQQQQQNPNEPNPAFASTPAVADLLPFFPSDATYIAGIDFGKVRASSQFPQYRDKLQQLVTQEVPTLSADCDIDIVEALHTAVLAGNKDNDDEVVAVVSSSVDWRGFNDCAAKSGIEFEQDGDISVYRGEHGTDRVRWLTENTFLVAVHRDERRIYDLGTGPSLADSLTAGLLANVDTGAMVWFAGAVDEADTRNSGLQLQGAVGLFGHGELPGAFSGRVGMAFDTEQHARSAATVMAKALDEARKGMAGPFLHGIDMAVEANNVLANVSFDKATVDMMLGMVGSQLGL